MRSTVPTEDSMFMRTCSSIWVENSVDCSSKPLA